MTNDLFEGTAEEFLPVALSGADVTIYPSFFTAGEATHLFDELLKTATWSHEHIAMFGKDSKLPRLTAWYGDAGTDYTYSGIHVVPMGWTETLLAIRDKIESVTNERFNSVLLNRYRTGSDSVAWHSDDEPELGTEPCIASISLGSVRKFQLKNRTDPSNKTSLELPHGSCLVMRADTQRNWLHQVPKTKKLVGERINLTYRFIH